VLIRICFKELIRKSVIQSCGGQPYVDNLPYKITN